MFYLFRGENLAVGFGYLSGTVMFPNEETLANVPLHSGGFQIDPLCLREVPNTHSNRRLFVYHQVVNLPQAGGQTPPSVSGHFRGMEIR
jgi:hypothetical protein